MNNCNLEEESEIKLNNRNLYHQKFSAFPRRVKLIVIQREGEDPENLEVTTENSFQIMPNNKIKNNLKSMTKSEENAIVRPKFCVTKNYFSYEIVTEFNNHPKLKKINSSYHLKRKISTKLKNDLKGIVNSLIRSINLDLNLALPLMTHNSKEFRENVKNEFLKIYGNQTVGKYISEDFLINRKQPKSIGLEKNKKLIANIEELYQSSKGNQYLNKLMYLLNQTLIKEFFKQFLESPRYKKCFEKDVKKYTEKLDELEKFNFNKKKIFIDIYSLKYDAIAQSYFG
jgi:hypothetical protein